MIGDATKVTTGEAITVMGSSLIHKIFL